MVGLGYGGGSYTGIGATVGRGGVRLFNKCRWGREAYIGTGMWWVSILTDTCVTPCRKKVFAAPHCGGGRWLFPLLLSAAHCSTLDAAHCLLLGTAC